MFNVSPALPAPGARVAAPSPPEPLGRSASNIVAVLADVSNRPREADVRGGCVAMLQACLRHVFVGIRPGGEADAGASVAVTGDAPASTRLRAIASRLGPDGPLMRGLQPGPLTDAGFEAFRRAFLDLHADLRALDAATSSDGGADAVPLSGPVRQQLADLFAVPVAGDEALARVSERLERGEDDLWDSPAARDGMLDYLQRVRDALDAVAFDLGDEARGRRSDALFRREVRID